VGDTGGEADDSHLRGGVVGLPDAADEARRGREVHERSAVLLPEVGSRGP
jgi:hypothetical protein